LAFHIASSSCVMSAFNNALCSALKCSIISMIDLIHNRIALVFMYMWKFLIDTIDFLLHFISPTL
jgi:hypothetical protein